MDDIETTFLAPIRFAIKRPRSGLAIRQLPKKAPKGSRSPSSSADFIAEDAYIIRLLHYGQDIGSNRIDALSEGFRKCLCINPS